MVADVERSQYSFAYTTFGGCDIKAVFAGTTIGEIQAISIQVTREKAGIYTMGSPNPRSFSRGKRGIAGSLIFIQFDRDAVLGALRGLKFQGDVDEIRPDNVDDGRVRGYDLRSASGRAADTPLGGGIGASEAPADLQQESQLTDISSDQVVMQPFYADQIPPFDVTLSAANEYGDLAVARIFGVEFLNEGWGISVDDLVSEKQYTYLARDVQWWKWQPNPDVVERLRDTGEGSI